MTKKNFKTGFDGLLTNSSTNKIKCDAQETLRATFVVNAEQLEKLKAISYWQRKKIKDTVEDAFNFYISDYEKKNGLIKLRE
ncbi:hypothetical protein [Rickettsia endosymbiont of Ixodes scapularis]|uniref:hypothetical protein n=1 Tax=Rickettsia endosymbiont of Ixodes scapularis TaxID=444612 RepID=UPI0003008B55|nr:hypothetical protein [Rickettsia endosymbiont of Ixodes scapularis]